MIRYETHLESLRAAVEDCKDSWLERAAERTGKFLEQKKYSERSSIWSEIKPVFIRLQKRKCVFCERALPGERYGLGEHDLEHFRPKSSVKRWPTAAIRRERKLDYDFDTGAAAAKGYYWLAYDLANYATACKTCNSALKSNCFPIAGERGVAAARVAELNASEQPFLIYPVAVSSDADSPGGVVDDDPEELIAFVGIVAVARHPGGHRSRRARVTIDFFELNNREELWQERFAVVRALWLAFRLCEQTDDPEEKDDAEQTIEDLVSPESPHTACARCFRDLFEEDPREAFRIYREARASLETPDDP